MEQQLEELKVKEQKLVLLFGQKVRQLYKSRDLRFFFTAQGRTQEAELARIVKLLDYLDARITAIEEVYADDESSSDEDDVEEEVEEVEEEIEEVEEEAAAVEEELPVAAEVVDEPAPVEEVDAPEVIADEEPLPVLETEPESIEELDPAEAALSQAVEDEIARNSDVDQEIDMGRDSLDSILESAKFTSDADRRLFESNIKKLQMGTAREREISIGQIGHTTAKDILLKVYKVAINDESSAVRLAVIKSVARMKDGADERFFELGIDDADEKVRIAAIKSLGSHVSDDHRRTLEGLLKDPSDHVRALAVTYLGIYYGKDSVRKAITVWTDESAHVRMSLLEMLSIVKPEGALKVIKNLLSDEDKDVKKAAEKALEKILPPRKKEGSYGKRKK